MVRAAAFKAESQRLSAQRQLWRRLEDYLDGQHLEHTQKAARELFPRRSQRWDKAPEASYRSYALVEMVSDRLSVTFDVPPATWLRRRGEQTVLPETDPQVRQWRRDAKDIDLAGSLQRIEALIGATENAVLHVAWRANRLRWDVYGPSYVYIHQCEEDPGLVELADEIAIELAGRADSLGNQRTQYLVWRRGGSVDTSHWTVTLHDRDGAPARQPHPIFELGGINGYLMHPVVVWNRRRPPTGSVWVPPPEPLATAQLGADLQHTELEHGVRFQAWGQWVEHGKPSEGDGEIGPDMLRRYMDLPADAGLSSVRPETDVSVLHETAEWKLRMLAVSQGLPPDTYSPNSSTRNLGAKEHESAGLEQRRQKGWPRYQQHLAQSFEITRAVGNYWQAQGAPRLRYDEDLELVVELAPLARVTDRQAEAQAQTAELAMGVITEVDVIMARERCARHEARQRYEQRLAERAELDALKNPT